MDDNFKLALMNKLKTIIAFVNVMQVLQIMAFAKQSATLY